MSFERNGSDLFSVETVAAKMAAGVVRLRPRLFLWQPRRGGAKTPIAAEGYLTSGSLQIKRHEILRRLLDKGFVFHSAEYFFVSGQSARDDFLPLRKAELENYLAPCRGKQMPAMIKEIIRYAGNFFSPFFRG
jgi:hypothetical protein